MDPRSSSRSVPSAEDRQKASSRSISSVVAVRKTYVGATVANANLNGGEGRVVCVGKGHDDRLAWHDLAAAFDDCHHSGLANDRRGRALWRGCRRGRLVGRCPVQSGQHDLEQPGPKGVDLGTGIAQAGQSNDRTAEIEQSPGRQPEQVEVGGEDVLPEIARPQLIAHGPALVEALPVRLA